MVTLPKEFVATRYPGYFWHLTEQRLYSLKVTGVLRPLVRAYPNLYNHFREGWSVSVNGKKRWLLLDELKLLKSKSSIFPVQED